MPIRPLTRGLRAWFLIDCALVLAAGIQLYVFARDTERLFAWTIAPPLTAAFLGASYWGSLPLLYLSSRRSAWAHARLAVFNVLAFTFLTTVATLLHLDRFHLHGPAAGARLAAWIWLAVYVVVPPALAVLAIQQLRAPGRDPEREAPLPDWLRLVLGLQAVIMGLAGVLLFFAQARALWPWPLTPLTARAVGAWLIGLAITAAHAAWENDLIRVRPMMAGYALLGVLQLGALVRFAVSVAWGRPQAFAYVAVLVSVLGVGLYGWAAAPRERDPGGAG